MKFRRVFINRFLEANEYDAIAVCYQELHYYIPDIDITFVAQHIDGTQGQIDQFTARRFSTLRNELLKITQDVLKQHREGFDSLSRKLYNTLEEFSCPKSVEPNISMSKAIFYILEALDEYVIKSVQYVEKYGEWEKHGPLNSGKSKKDCLVYLKERMSFKSKAYKKDDFRAMLTATHLGDIFTSFQIIDKTRFPPSKEPPHIVRIPLRDTCKGIEESQVFRIATIPFIGFHSFSFHELASRKACQSDEVPNGVFYIDYPANTENDNAQYVLSLLELAIKQDANFIVFPEFIMSSQMRKSISKRLKELEKASKVILVFAGTTYEWNASLQKGNNVLHILNGKGTEVGRYYKYSPFFTKDKSMNRRNPLDKMIANKDLTFFKNLELLSDRGKECDLFDVDLIGRILPAICRDIVDGDYTQKLIDLFKPSMLLAPAWSRSVASFETFLEHYANTTHTTSLLCNCCNAVGFPAFSDNSSKTIGKFCMPFKNETVMDATSKPITRKADCRNSCRDKGGCVIMIDVDFSENVPNYTIEAPKRPCCPEDRKKSV